MRYVYVKNGNAVEQVRRITSVGPVDQAGPDGFIGSLIASLPQDDVLVLSRWHINDEHKAGKVWAKSFRVSGNPLARMFHRVTSAILVGRAALCWRPDRILCGCTGELLWVCALVSKLRGIPMVHSRHNEVQARKGIGRLIPLLDALSIRSCQGVVCHGPFLREQMKELGVPREAIFEFEVDLRDFSLTTPPKPVDYRLKNFCESMDLVLAFVGRIQVDKGVIDLLDAVRALRDQCDRKIGIVYAGQGADLAFLKERTSARSCREFVLILGPIEHKELPSVMRCADLIVAPTRPEFPEGRCMVVLESLALGIPVIAPDFGPFPFAVQDGVNGLLFTPGNQASLSRALLRVVENGELLRKLYRGAEASGHNLVESPHDSFSTAVAMAFRKLPALVDR